MLTENKRIDNILPTLHALEQNVKRSAYQAGHILVHSLIGYPGLPLPHMWVWQREKMMLHGPQSGPLCQKQSMHVISYCNVDAKIVHKQTQVC